MEPMRLQKWLSQRGICSRREAERLILTGQVRLNSEIVSELGTKLNPEVDKVEIKGMPVKRDRPPLVYWILNKPDRALTSHRGEDGMGTIFELPSLRDLPFKVFTVGRLDFRTEGLLILSNDGEFVHKLTHPKFKLARQYYCLINERLTKDEEKALKEGVVLADGPVRGVELQYAHKMNLGASSGFWYLITVYEGRNRLVRRLFENFDRRVHRLIRFRMGPIGLPENLAPGQYRALSPSELKSIRQHFDSLA